MVNIGIIKRSVIILFTKGPVYFIKKSWYYLFKREESYFVDKKPPLPSKIKFYPQRILDPDKFSVLFYTDFQDDHVGSRYRIYNLIEQLAILEIKASYLREIANRTTWDWIAKFDILVIYRTRYTSTVQMLIEFAAKMNIAAVYSIDDLVFNEEILHQISGFSKLGEIEKRVFSKVVKMQKEALLSCRYAIVTTETLKTEMEKLGRKGFIIRNGLNSVQIEASKRALKKKVTNTQKIFLGYFSGTKTHDDDFRVIKNPLLNILNDFPHVNLFIIGPVDLDKDFNKYESRTSRQEMVHWTRLPDEMIKADINLVPLQLPNRFIEGKSELKYFESAFLKIPTIASPSEAFRFAIKSGLNGYLVKSEDDWYTYIKELVLNKRLRERIGDAAYSHTISTYTPEIQSNNTYRVFQKIMLDYLNKGYN